MTRAKITAKNGYNCAPRGFKVEHFPFGTVVDGQVAEWALADRAASRMFDPRQEIKVTAPDEVKSGPKPKRGRKRKGGNVRPAMPPLVAPLPKKK